MRLAVDIDPVQNEGPIAIELGASRRTRAPEGSASVLGRRVQGRGGLTWGSWSRRPGRLRRASDRTRSLEAAGRRRLRPGARRLQPLRRAGLPRADASPTTSRSPSASGSGRSRSASARTASAASRTRASPTSPTWTSATASSIPTTSAPSTMRATASGTATAPSSGCRPWRRCSPAARSRPRAARPSTPISARPGTRCPADRKRGLESLVVEHSFVYSRGLIGYDQFTDAERAAVPPVPQAVVRTHPGDGTQVALRGLARLATSSAGRSRKGRALLRELLDFATQPQFVYATSGGGTTSSCGTTAACSIAAARGTSGATAASCTGRRSPAPAPPRSTATRFPSASPRGGSSPPTPTGEHLCVSKQESVDRGCPRCSPP